MHLGKRSFVIGLARSKETVLVCARWEMSAYPYRSTWHAKLNFFRLIDTSMLYIESSIYNDDVTYIASRSHESFCKSVAANTLFHSLFHSLFLFPSLSLSLYLFLYLQLLNLRSGTQRKKLYQQLKIWGICIIPQICIKLCVYVCVCVCV